VEAIDCDLPPERALELRETPAFLALANQVRAALREGHSYD
jgi:NitT/TauT family transport system ATP-binding protein